MSSAPLERPLHVYVRYRTKPDRADENQHLIEKVFAALDEMGATGFGCAALRLEDGVSLADVPTFREFTAGIEDRCDEPSAAMGATIVGAHRISAGDRRFIRRGTP